MIFVVEDEIEILELLQYALDNNGLDSRGFSNPDDFLATLEGLDSNNMPNMVILDVGLPEKSGIEVIKILRSKGSTKDIPIILLTAKSSEMDKVRGLNSGADDYITKPFGVLELIARIRALLRRTEGQSTREYRYKEIYINTATRVVHINNEEIAPTFKEFELLLMFVSNPHLVFSREQLLYAIWGNEFQTRTVDVHINTLRSKLGKYGKYIQTVRGVGYKIS